MNAGNSEISRRDFLALTVTGTATVLLGGYGWPADGFALTSDPATKTGSVSYAKLPRWRGFNLVDKQTLERNKHYEEWDFDVIAEWGFDFVRLPLDYRIWTNNAGAYIEGPLREIDQALTWARARGIHVNLCLHRAPGYCVGGPKEKLDLWADGLGGNEARTQFAAQWRMFATRYRDVPSSALSFNLVNEPPTISNQQYLRVAKAGVDAIRSIDADRLVIADGKAVGTMPAPELADLKIAQSTRGYSPMQISHYKATWIKGSDHWPVPTWPLAASVNSYIYGDNKSTLQRPLVLRGSFTSGMRISVKVQTVSSQAQLLIQADGVTLNEYWFKPGAGQGDWKNTTFKPEWGIYQATYDKEYVVLLPRAAKEVAISVGKGDWLTFSEIRITPHPVKPKDSLVIKPPISEWGVRQTTFIIDSSGNINAEGSPAYDKNVLWKEEIEPWKKLESMGIGVHVGEWGVHRFTPHGVALAWMNDRLDLWKQAEWGWALWNLRGPFGPLDSDRSDVVYENFKGHKLDRKMLEMLKRG